MRDKSLIDIYILEILSKHASEEKRITQEQIIAYLDYEYNIQVSRKTLSSYLAELRDNDYIKGQRGICKTNRFTDAEIRVLIDGVLYGKQLPVDKAQQLITKLKQLSFVSLSHKVNNITYLYDSNRTENVAIYDNLDMIDKAILERKKIKVIPCRYNLKGKLVEGNSYIASPYHIVADKNMYYLICCVERAGYEHELSNRRIDRMSKVEIVDEDVMAITQIRKYCNGFHLNQYLKEHIYMFSGDSQRITFKLKKYNMSDFIDWFGKDYYVEAQDEEYVTVSVTTNSNAAYYWTLQYGEVVELIAPQNLRERVKAGLQQMLEKYE